MFLKQSHDRMKVPALRRAHLVVSVAGIRHAHQRFEEGIVSDLLFFDAVDVRWVHSVLSSLYGVAHAGVQPASAEAWQPADAFVSEDRDHVLLRQLLDISGNPE